MSSFSETVWRPSSDESIGPVTILDAQGRVLCVVSAEEFRRSRPTATAQRVDEPRQQRFDGRGRHAKRESLPGDPASTNQPDDHPGSEHLPRPGRPRRRLRDRDRLESLREHLATCILPSEERTAAFLGRETVHGAPPEGLRLSLAN